MARAKRPIRHVVRTSPRFPQLSSPAWVEFRRDPDAASKRFKALREQLLPLGVFDRLVPSQAVELVGLAGRIHQFAVDARIERYSRKQLRKARSEAGRRGRKVRGKLQNVADALNDLAAYLDDFHDGFWGDLLIGLGDTRPPSDEKLLVPDKLRADADRYLKMRLLTESEIDELEAEARADLDERAAHMPIDVAEVRKAISLELSGFFIGTCGLSRRESDIRASKIGNALLGWTLPFREHEESADRKRSAETLRSRRRRAIGGQDEEVPH